MSNSPSKLKAKKGVGLNAESRIHYTDHLAVICVIMGVPLLFVEEQDRAIAEQYYPGLQTACVDFQEFNPELLIANYDVLFMSDLWDRRTMREKFGLLEQKYNKVMRNVHVPHGFSDKAFYLKKVAMEDITLIYGQNMLDMLEAEGVLPLVNQYVITGNYRYTYYKLNLEFFKPCVQAEVLDKFIKPQRTILYAPTWMDLENSTTFFEHYETILGKLPDDWNIIVKLHPRLELDDVVTYYQILGKYDRKPNILFLRDYPLVYPLLDVCDVYLGDMSSIGYDFLAFNKPMFFLNAQNRDSARDRGLYLFRCGIELKPDQFSQLYSLMEKEIPKDQERFASIRQEVYDYTFGPERPFSEIKSDIIKAYSSPFPA